MKRLAAVFVPKRYSSCIPPTHLPTRSDTPSLTSRLCSAPAASCKRHKLSFYKYIFCERCSVYAFKHVHPATFHSLQPTTQPDGRTNQVQLYWEKETVPSMPLLCPYTQLNTTTCLLLLLGAILKLAPRSLRCSFAYTVCICVAQM